MTDTAPSQLTLDQVIRRRRMVHRFLRDPLPQRVVDDLCEVALHAPSAGFSQGFHMLVLDTREQLEMFWRTTGGEDHVAHMLETGPPVIVLPLPYPRAYLERYSEPDKAPAGLGESPDRWPVKFWDLDAAMAVMLMLLKATDLGIGAWYWGIFQGERELMEALGVPEGVRPIGAVGFGYKAPDDRPMGSWTTRKRRSTDEVVHRGRW